MSLPHPLRLAWLPALAAALACQSPPAGFEQVDFDVRIGVLPGQLRFDKERFTVSPGSKVKLTLSNSDAMQHNLVLCQRGEDVTVKVAGAALRLGAKASEMHFVPEMDEVLASTKAIFLDQSDTIWFRAPQQPGDYPYVCTLPGHAFTMVGVMRVGGPGNGEGNDGEAAGAVPIGNLRYRVFRGKWRTLPDFSELTPFREGDLDGGLLQLGPLGERNNFGAVFTGSLELQSTGRHTFFLNSDDGSRVFVDDREVVAYDGVHGPAEEQQGTVQLAAGAHQLRVEFFQGGGGQALRLAYAGPDGQRRKLWAKQQAPPKVTPIAVHHHPVVTRVHVEGATARTIAVGLPGGINYCFDAQRCCVQFGWAGAYLDVGPDRDGRGGRPCRTLGPRFEVGDVGFPLRAADGAQRPVRFRGYRRMPVPAFELDWGGVGVTWAIAPAAMSAAPDAAAGAGAGLQYTFRLDEPLAAAARFEIDPEGLDVTSTIGRPVAGKLPLPAGTREFSVTVRSKEGVR